MPAPITSRPGFPYIELAQHVSITANGVWYWQLRPGWQHSAPYYYHHGQMTFLTENI